MNTSGEAADQVVRMTLNGVEVAAKITGAEAKELAALLYTVMKAQTQNPTEARVAMRQSVHTFYPRKDVEPVF